LDNYSKDILKIALPSIVSNITVPLLGLVDVGITGHLGSQVYLGAIAVGGMLFNIIYWMFAFLRMGTSGMTAQAFGREDANGMVMMLVRSLCIALSIGFVFICLSPFIREGALFIISPSAEVIGFARSYFNICVLGVPAGLGLFALNGWFVGMQNSRIPMFVAIFQNIFNIAVSCLLVYGLKMKVEGVALGTMTAQWGGFLLAMLLLYLKYHGIWKGMCIKGVWDRVEMSKFFTVNRDIFLRTLCLIAVHFFFISAGAKQGDTELAVNTLLMQFFTLYSYIMDGFAFAGEALTGKAIGAQDKKLYTNVMRQLFVIGTIMVCLFTLSYALGTENLIRVLTDTDAVVAMAMEYKVWTLLFPICGMAAFVWDGIYIGATETRYMLMSTFAGMSVFFICYFTLFPYYHNHSLWIAYLGNLTFRGVVLTLTRKNIYKRFAILP